MSSNSEAIKYLENESNSLINPERDPEDLIVPDKNITKAQAIQNDDSTWSVVQYEEKNPNELHSTILENNYDRRSKQISDLKEVCVPLDTQLKDINDQINSKKSELMSKLAEAVGAGCSMIQFGFNILNPLSPLLLVDAGDVNGTGISIGAGLSVKSDTASLKKFTSLTNYTTDNPFDPEVTEAITYTNAGDGYVSIVGNNDGSIISSDYKEINTSPLFPPPNQPECVGYSSAITALAVGINSLRAQRDALNLSAINVVKDEKLTLELEEWGLKSGDVSMETRRTDISNVVTSINNVS